MTTPGVPTAVEADGAVRAVYVAALANPLEPTVAEVTAGSALDLSCYLTPTGYNATTEEEAKDNSRFCSRERFESPGRENNGLELTYVYDPQNRIPAENKAYTTLKRLTKGFIVVRWGVDCEEPFTEGDVVDVQPITCGSQRKLSPEANSDLKVSQKMSISGPVRRDVELVAA